MEFKIITPEKGEDSTYNSEIIAKFLHTHLEQYGDSIEDILKCIAYAMNPSKGGTIVLGLEEGKIVGACVLNNTGMKDYIPENILVYIAVYKSYRGKVY